MHDFFQKTEIRLLELVKEPAARAKVTNAFDSALHLIDILQVFNEGFAGLNRAAIEHGVPGAEWIKGYEASVDPSEKVTIHRAHIEALEFILYVGMRGAVPGPSVERALAELQQMNATGSVPGPAGVRLFQFANQSLLLQRQLEQGLSLSDEQLLARNSATWSLLNGADLGDAEAYGRLYWDLARFWSSELITRAAHSGASPVMRQRLNAALKTDEAAGVKLAESALQLEPLKRLPEFYQGFVDLKLDQCQLYQSLGDFNQAQGFSG